MVPICSWSLTAKMWAIFSSVIRGSDAIDREAIANWVDDRLVDFVKTYLSLHENEWYLKDHMVVDPVADVRFPKFAAAATIELEGKTYYFVGEETRREFEAKHGAASR